MTLGDQWMIGRVDLALDRQAAQIQRLRLGIAPLAAVEIAQQIQAECHQEVVRTQCRFADLQRPRQKGLGFLVALLVVQQIAQMREIGGHIRVVGA